MKTYRGPPMTLGLERRAACQPMDEQPGGLCLPDPRALAGLVDRYRGGHLGIATNLDTKAGDRGATARPDRERLGLREQRRLPERRKSSQMARTPRESAAAQGQSRAGQALPSAALWRDTGIHDVAASAYRHCRLCTAICHPDRGAQRRGARGDLGRVRPRCQAVDDPGRAHESEPRPYRSTK